MSSYTKINSRLKKIAKETPPAKGSYFKTGPGDYAEKDKFMGVNNPTLRKLSKEYHLLPMLEIQRLMKSPFNEERMLALFILILQFQKGKNSEQEKIAQFYLKHLKYVNNWNLVDASAHLILGCYLFDSTSDGNKDSKSKKNEQEKNNSKNKSVSKNILLRLSRSKEMWERRVAIVATWYFIRQDQHELTYLISKILLQDEHDLIHKAVGWMLRESGKKNVRFLIKFLEENAHKMPRTMLRYAIEKFPENKRKAYLLL